MKTLLVDLLPRSLLFKGPSFMPIYVTSLAASLRNAGHEVMIIERGRLDRKAKRSRPALFDLFRRDVQKFSPDIVLFDVRQEVLTDLKALGQVTREAAPGSTILAGGRHATLLPDQILVRNTFLDGAVINEPEQVVLALAGGADPLRTPSLALRQTDKIVRTSPGEHLDDLDLLPLPAWDLLDMAYYTRKSSRAMPCFYRRTATLESSRGCSHGCSFCSEGSLNHPSHRFHSAGYLVEALEKLMIDYGFEAVYFCDENFLGKEERVEELCQELIGSGLAEKLIWSAQVRSDKVHPQILSLMKKSGCVQLEFGIESGSQRMLDLVFKGTKVKQNMETLQLVRKAGLRSLAYIIFGLPGERMEDIRQTAEFLDQANPDILRLIPYIPLAGTPLVKDLISRNELDDEFWEEETLTGNPYGGSPPNLTAMSDEEFSCAYRRLYFRFAFPRYAVDFLRHHRLKDYLSVFKPFAPFFIISNKFFPSLLNRL